MVLFLQRPNTKKNKIKQTLSENFGMTSMRIDDDTRSAFSHPSNIIVDSPALTCISHLAALFRVSLIPHICMHTYLHVFVNGGVRVCVCWRALALRLPV